MRGEWIEITLRQDRVLRPERSPLMRGEWIEIEVTFSEFSPEIIVSPHERGVD